MDYAISNHAKIEMQRRGISMECAHNVMTKPDQILDSYGQRIIYQSRLLMDSKDWIVRLIVEE
ncbi:DUF4258 domain-containing protein [Desulfonatronum thioautotrophicum]|uniref:DUF4258 domain-containing protein n=1 Tax=Desulfonatronum thioautotrophicum TaxID=617001 RepID=UPI00129474CB|nr:DUF4258 domain-containing protein [Desulfonatronum thioautotrophicum]